MSSYRLAVAVMVLGIGCGAPGGSPGDERVLVVKAPKLISASAGSLVLEGRWRLHGRRDSNFSLARLNSSYVTCSKANKICEETVAELRSEGDGERLGIKSGELLASCHTYEITEWTENVVVGVSRKPVADLVIRIDLKAQEAERLFREREDPTKASSYTLE
jgi:hypothetical protein